MSGPAGHLLGAAAAALLALAPAGAPAMVGAADDQAVPVAGADRPGTTAPRLDPGRYVDTFSRGGIGEYGAMGTTKYYVIDARPACTPTSR